MATTTEGQEAIFILGRVEGKLDAYASAQRATDEKVEALDGRLRDQEAKSVVTPAGLLAALVGTVAIVGGIAQFVHQLPL